MKPFSREELQDIRDRAQKFSETAGLVPSWRKAWEELAHAADAMDAIIQRACTDKVGERKKEG